MLLNEEQQQFVTLADMYYSINGRLFTEEEAFDEFGIPCAEYTKFLKNDKVQAALKERDLAVGKPLNSSGEPKDAKGAWRANALTPEQLMVANAMLDLVDTRSQKKKLQDMGVTTAKYQRWLKLPAFQKYLRHRAETMLGENQHEAHMALLDKIRSGDLKAISYYNEMTGYYVPASARTATSSTNTQVDVQNLIIRILEIIEDEVTDVKAKVNIADRLKGLAVARTIAGELVAS